MYVDSEDLLGKWFVFYFECCVDIFFVIKFVFQYGFNGLIINSFLVYCCQQCEKSFWWFGILYIDFYYIYCVDGKMFIEYIMVELVKLKVEGKIWYIGILVVLVDIVCWVVVIDYVDVYQVEYSFWLFDIEGFEINYLFQICWDLGVVVFVYFLLGRGIMMGQIKLLDDFEFGDLRWLFFWFSKENFFKNLVLVEKFRIMVDKKGCMFGQLIVVWLMVQGEDIFFILGMKNIKYLEENVGVVWVEVSEDEEREIWGWLNDFGFVGIWVLFGLLDEFNDMFFLLQVL